MDVGADEVDEEEVDEAAELTARQKFEDGVDATVPYVTAGGALLAIAITGFSEVPSSLPGIALGSEALFYFERGLAVLAGVVILLMLLVNGLKQRVPTEATTTGVTYSDSVRKGLKSSNSLATALAERTDRLEAKQKTQNEALASLLEDLRQRTEKGEG